MVKNLQVNSLKDVDLYKSNFHSIISELKKLLNFSLQSLEITIVNSEYIFELNKTYLKHNYSTDIITFAYSDSVDELDGEIFISIDDAVENAKNFNVSLNSEILRLIIHGILHLIGYDDISSSDRRKMKLEENKLVKILEAKNLKFIKNYD